MGEEAERGLDRVKRDLLPSERPNTIPVQRHIDGQGGGAHNRYEIDDRNGLELIVALQPGHRHQEAAMQEQHAGHGLDQWNDLWLAKKRRDIRR